VLDGGAGGGGSSSPPPYSTRPTSTRGLICSLLNSPAPSAKHQMQASYTATSIATRLACRATSSSVAAVAAELPASRSWGNRGRSALKSVQTSLVRLLIRLSGLRPQRREQRRQRRRALHRSPPNLLRSQSFVRSLAARPMKVAGTSQLKPRYAPIRPSSAADTRRARLRSSRAPPSRPGRQWR
jgi:hypothetical protein